MDNNELMHYGVRGMKWGVRRYQNKDGTLTAAGKRRARTDGGTSGKVAINKKNVAKVAIGTATVAAAAYYVHKNPDKIGKALSGLKNKKVADISTKALKAGKDYVKAMPSKAAKAAKTGAKNAVAGVKEGVREGVKEAPKKAAKAVVTGVVLNATKKALDKGVGKEESARIFQANDNKKIGKFWHISGEDKEDD